MQFQFSNLVMSFERNVCLLFKTGPAVQMFLVTASLYKRIDVNTPYNSKPLQQKNLNLLRYQRPV